MISHGASEIFLLLFLCHSNQNSKRSFPFSFGASMSYALHDERHEQNKGNNLPEHEGTSFVTELLLMILYHYISHNDINLIKACEPDRTHDSPLFIFTVSRLTCTRQVLLLRFTQLHHLPSRTRSRAQCELIKLKKISLMAYFF